MEQLILWLDANAPSSLVLILSALGGLTTIGLAVVALTPGKADDEWLEKQKEKPLVANILKFFAAFSPLAKKEKGGLGLAVQPTEKPEEKK